MLLYYDPEYQHRPQAGGDGDPEGYAYPFLILGRQSRPPRLAVVPPVEKTARIMFEPRPVRRAHRQHDDHQHQPRQRHRQQKVQTVPHPGGGTAGGNHLQIPRAGGAKNHREQQKAPADQHPEDGRSDVMKKQSGVSGPVETPEKKRFLFHDGL